MKDVFIVYDTSCFFEIVILNYFMSFRNCDVVICSLDGKPIKTMEGYSVNVDMPLSEVNKDEIRSFIVPGGNISKINNDEMRQYLQDLKKNKVLIAAICSGVDLLDDSGILKEIKSTHSTEHDIVNDKRVITARANAYVDFAIEVGKELKLIEDEEDLKETIEFWKNYKRVQ